MDPGHVAMARDNAVKLQTYLVQNPGVIAHYTVRCYQHEKAEVERVVLEELRRIVHPVDLKRIRITYVEFKALGEVPGVLDLGTLFVQCPKADTAPGNRAVRRAAKRRARRRRA